MKNWFLKYYLQHGYLDKKGSLLSLLFPKTISNHAAKKVFHLLDISNNSFTPDKTISLRTYNGKNQQANNIKDLLTNSNSRAIFAAVVHGSIASNEIVPYSDFDGILIIDDSKITTINELLLLREVIITTQQEMRQMDSLQHHGWHLLLKSELSDYNESNLPLILIESGKLLFPSNPFEINIKLNLKSQEYHLGFKLLKDSITKKIQTKKHISNFYTFKNFISELLLVPAMYYQALNNEPIVKKSSFEWLKSILPIEQYSFFQELSELRLNWSQERVIVENEIIAEKFKLIKFISLAYRTKLPNNYKEWLNPSRKANLLSILNVMSQNILLKHS